MHTHVARSEFVYTKGVGKAGEGESCVHLISQSVTYICKCWSRMPCKCRCLKKQTSIRKYKLIFRNLSPSLRAKIRTMMRAIIAHRLVRRPVPIVNRIIRFTTVSLSLPVKSPIERRSRYASAIVIAESPSALKMLMSRPKVNISPRSVSSVIWNL